MARMIFTVIQYYRIIELLLLLYYTNHYTPSYNVDN